MGTLELQPYETQRTNDETIKDKQGIAGSKQIQIPMSYDHAS